MPFAHPSKKGNKAVKIWNTAGQQLEMDPKDLQSYELTAVVKPTGFWNMSKECGVSFDCVSVLVGSTSMTCPFSLDDEWIST